MNMSV